MSISNAPVVNRRDSLAPLLEAFNNRDLDITSKYRNLERQHQSMPQDTLTLKSSYDKAKADFRTLDHSFQERNKQEITEMTHDGRLHLTPFSRLKEKRKEAFEAMKELGEKLLSKLLTR